MGIIGAVSGTIGRGLSRRPACHLLIPVACILCLPVQRVCAQATGPVDTQVPVEKPAGDFEPIAAIPPGVQPPTPAANMSAGASASAPAGGAGGGSGAAGAAGVNDILN